MTTKEAMKHVTHVMKTDPSYRIGWQANIAVAFSDSAYHFKRKNKKQYLTALDIHIIANEAANNFLNSLCK